MATYAEDTRGNEEDTLHDISEEPNENAETENDEDAEGQPEAEAEDYVAKYELGCYAPWDWSAEQIYLSDDLEEDVRGALVGLTLIAARSDQAARRFEVEQAWEAEMFFRGYQHLLPRRGGGFQLPGEDTKWGPMAQLNRQAVYNTNIYSKTGDILISAICRELPKVQFFPICPDSNPDVTMAETANKYKWVYSKNNNLKDIQRDIAHKFCTQDRVVLYTRHVLDATEYGFQDDPEPASPETAEAMPEDDANQVVQRISELLGGEKKEARRPKGMEITSVFDKLGSKVLVSAKNQSKMPWLQLYEEDDCASARASFPFISEKIRPGGTGTGEVELDRIARINTDLALQGAYVTGDSYNRDVTIQRTWMRPKFFWDQSVRSEIREKLLERFPKGCLVVRVGPEFAFCRNESLDDKVKVLHALPGKGQNRRALLTPCISVQKRLNDWMDLMGDFFVRTVPKRFYDQNTFAVEKMKETNNVPGGAIPFIRRPGTPVSELIHLEPTPQAQPQMGEFIKWFESDLNNDLSGALSTIFGGATDINTAQGAAIQRDQALGRLGVPWNAIQEGFAESHRQAVKAAAEARKQNIDEMVDGHGRITIQVADMNGNVACYPEYDANFPESYSQRESRFYELWKSAPENPLSMELLKSAKNRKIAKDALRFSDLEIVGAAEYEKQEGEFEILLKTGPVPNPDVVKIQTLIKQTTDGMAQEIATGAHNPQEVQQAAPMLDQLEQHAESLPQEVSTVPVAQDKSEDHVIEAQACYDWMNSSEGRRYKHGSEQERAAYQNVYVHWQEHTAMAEKLADDSQALKSTGESISVPLDKMPPNVAIQALAKIGITATPEDFEQKDEADTKKTVTERTAPHVIRKLTRS
jgi:hypothetical protein